MSKVYLKPTVQVEPLIWKWYAWPYLISPATAACNIVERHLKIMQSYVKSPQIHAQAVKNPAMIGGPFVDYEEQRVEEIKNLIEVTKKNCETLIALNSAIKEFDKVLQNEAKGASLEALYKKIPILLRGCVELVYDLNHHPSIRFIEAFLYKLYYSDSCQQITLINSQSDFRKFILSTPSINEKDKVYLDIPFSDKRLDRLFRLKQEPCALDEIVDLLNVSKTQQASFKELFSTTPANEKQDRNYKGKGVRVRYFGHACVLVQTDKTSILFDPAISYPVQNDIPRYTFEDLPDHIDYAVITHNHTDHLMFESLLQLRHKIGHVVFPVNHKGMLADPSIRLILEKTGFSSLIELDEMQTISFKDGEIIGIPFLGEHCDLQVHSKISYCVKIKDKKFIFAADSNNLDEYLYQHIFDLIGSIDMLFLGMECEGAPLTWIYGPLLTMPITRELDRSRTLSGSNFDKAWSIVEKLKCKHAYVYAMGQEPWLNHVMALNYSPDSIQMVESNKFVEKCKENGIESERLFGRKEWLVD